MDNKVLEVALQAYMDGWCKSVEGTKRCIATWDDETDVAHARAGVRAALLAAMPVLLGEPVAWQRRIRASESHWSDWEEWIDMYGYGMQPKIGRWDAEYRPVYAPSLGEGDGR